jgi:hypothetical protein
VEEGGRRQWTLLTSHGHVLVEIARNPRSRVRDISAAIGITERATQAIIADLERAGYVERVRTGRRTHYVLHPDSPFRHSAQDGLQVGPFLELLTDSAGLAGAAGLTDSVGLASAAELTNAAGLADTAEPVLPTPEEIFLAAAGAPDPAPDLPPAIGLETGSPTVGPDGPDLGLR